MINVVPARALSDHVLSEVSELWGVTEDACSDWPMLDDASLDGIHSTLCTRTNSHLQFWQSNTDVIDLIWKWMSANLRDVGSSLPVSPVPGAGIWSLLRISIVVLVKVGPLIIFVVILNRENCHFEWGAKSAIVNTAIQYPLYNLPGRHLEWHLGNPKQFFHCKHSPSLVVQTDQGIGRWDLAHPSSRNTSQLVPWQQMQRMTWH